MAPLLALLFFACESQGPVQDVPAEASSEQPSPSPKLPTPGINMPADLCDNGPGGVGAASYFEGAFTIDENRIRGLERWVLKANRQWKAAGGSDCTIEWAILGTGTPPTNCVDCTFSVTGTAELKADSQCPEGLWKDEQTHALAYNVQFDATHHATVFFAKSGNKLGNGHHSARGFNYISEPSCRWF